MRRSKLVLGPASLLGLLLGCSTDKPMSIPTGAEAGPCTAGGGCDPGLICLSHLCVRPPDSAISSASGGAGGTGVVSGGSGGNAGTVGGGGVGAGGAQSGGAGGSEPSGFCGGVPMACAMYGTQLGCQTVGCYWSAATPIAACAGTGAPCATFTTQTACFFAGCTWQLGTPPDAGVRDANATGGAAGSGGTPALGGRGGTGGIAPTGGVIATGGTRASGGTVSTGGISTGGAGGGLCSNVSPCGGDVVGTWTVTSSCLNVSGQLDVMMMGLGCASAPVTGTLQVTGTWTARADGTYLDNTVTTGTEWITLPASCLIVSSVPVTCEKIGPALAINNYSAVTCVGMASGECACTATVEQAGGPGLPSPFAGTSGTYTVSANVLTTDGEGQYSYCVSGNRMTWTPKGPNPTTTGSIVFQSVGPRGTGGSPATGGRSGTGGVRGTGGAGGSGGSIAPGILPCDVLSGDGGPCVAAHSTIRRLSSAYNGPLYQVRVGGSNTGTGGTTTDIGFLADGYADSGAQDAACGATACTISIIYDQSGHGNDLTPAPPGGAKMTADHEANAKAVTVALGGHNLYGVHIVPGVAYRNNRATGTATGDNAETIYMVVAGDFYNGGCCFDYGNVESNSRDNGEGAAEAVYFGNCTIWNKGAGDGPWVMGDLENGLWAGNYTPYTNNPSLLWKYVVGMVKGDEAGKNHWTIKAGNAQSGALTLPYDGPRPSSRYNPMRKEGAITLGAAGDNSNGAQGNFFEGVMTARYSSDAADDAVQANIVTAYR